MNTMKKFKLPKAKAEIWLKALRSGEYLQGKHRLYDTKTNSYCCIGVACELFSPENDYWKVNEAALPNENNSSGNVPKELKVDVVCIDSNPFTDLLTAMNDYDGEEDGEEDDILISNGLEPKTYSFAEIADYIEQNTEFYREEI